MSTSPQILLVDDDPDVREVVRTILRTRDYVVHEAANGQIGLDMIDEVKPDLMILDLMMPGMSGLEVLKQMRAREIYPGVPLLILSAAGDKSEQPEEFWRQGLQVDEYMSKASFTPENLLGRVAYLLKRASYKSMQPSATAGDSSTQASPSPKTPVVDLASAPPAEVVRHFIEAWNTRQFGVEFDCLGGKMAPPIPRADFIARRMVRAEEPRERNLQQKLSEILDAQIEEKTATIRVRREDIRGNRPVARTEVYSLEHMPEGWKITNVKITSSH